MPKSNDGQTTNQTTTQTTSQTKELTAEELTAEELTAEELRVIGQVPSRQVTFTGGLTAQAREEHALRLLCFEALPHAESVQLPPPSETREPPQPRKRKSKKPKPQRADVVNAEDSPPQLLSPQATGAAHVTSPSRIPVATVAIGKAGAINAALLAAALLATYKPEISTALSQYRKNQTQNVLDTPSPQN